MAFVTSMEEDDSYVVVDALSEMFVMVTSGIGGWKYVGVRYVSRCQSIGSQVQISLARTGTLHGNRNSTRFHENSSVCEKVLIS